MKKKVMYVLICSGLLAAATIYSCKKETTTTPATTTTTTAESDVQSVTDNGTAESEYTNVMSESNDVMSSETGATKTSGSCTGTRGCSSCVQWTIDSCSGINNFPKTITLDYSAINAAGCLGCDLRTRKGKIVIVLSGKWFTAGSTATITPVDYYVDGNKFDGVIKYTNVNGIDTGNGVIAGTTLKPTFTKVVSDVAGGTGYSTITLASGAGTIKWKCNRTVEMTAGYWTPRFRGDDSFKTWGNADGINRNNQTFSISVATSTPLNKAFDCKWFKDGELVLTPAGLNARTLNFSYPAAQGSGVCDGDVQVTVNGITKVVTIP